MKKPILIAFGYEARSGKGECALSIERVHSLEHGGRYKVLRTSFAKRLREEVMEGLFDRWVQDRPDEPFPSHNPQIAMRHLCQWAGVEYDENAPVDELYPLGKQRKLYQWWGTEYRRNQFGMDYWLDAVADEIEREQPDVAVIDDLRFPNEHGWVEGRNGTTVRTTRPGLTPITNGIPGHVSESALANHLFHYYIDNDGSLNDLQGKALALFDEVVELKATTCKHCGSHIRENPTRSNRWVDSLNDPDCGLRARTWHEPKETD